MADRLLTVAEKESLLAATLTSPCEPLRLAPAYWSDICAEIKRARGGEFPDDWRDLILTRKLWHDETRAKFPLVAAWIDLGFRSNEYYNVDRALGGTPVGTHRSFFKAIHDAGLVDESGNATEGLVKQYNACTADAARRAQIAMKEESARADSNLWKG